jgi:copper transport protein
MARCLRRSIRCQSEEHAKQAGAGVGSALVPQRTRVVLSRSVVALVLGLIALVTVAAPASAHNSFVVSDPADGAQLASVPTQLALTFAKDVGLEELQVDFTDAAGVRSVLAGFAHSPAGKTTVLVPVPTQASGSVSFRWKLVASDGHTVSGRVGLKISPPTAPTTTGAVVTSTEAAANLSAPPLAPVSTTRATAVSALPSVQASSFSSSGVGTLLRWLLRLAAFVGLLAIAGSIVTSSALWGGAWNVPRVRQIAAWGIGLVMGATLLLLLLFRSEAGSMKLLLNTSYGLALALRLVFLPVVAVYLFTWFPDEIKRWAWVGGMLVGVAATWTWSGHPRSLRWPLLGVPLDLVHLVAACVWIGGLVFMGLVVMRTATAQEQVAAAKAFAPVASRSVTALVVTGVLQTFRIDRGPAALFTTNHGRLLILKIVLLGLMLYVANVNRTRVATRLRAEDATRGLRTMLQRAMVTEAAVGLAILAVTAALVVNSPPS